MLVIKFLLSAVVMLVMSLVFYGIADTYKSNTWRSVFFGAILASFIEIALSVLWLIWSF